MKKYQTGHFGYPWALLTGIVFMLILTLAAAGVAVACIWIEELRTAAAWFGVACGVGWVYVGLIAFEEEVRETFGL